MKKILVITFVVSLVVFFLGAAYVLVFKPCPDFYPANVYFDPAQISLREKGMKWYVETFCPVATPVSFIKRALAQSSARDLENLKDSFPDLVLAYDKVSVFDAWQLIDKKRPTTTTTVIAVIDTGVDSKHPEFINVNLGLLGPLASQALKDQAEDFRSDLLAGHGTAVAGIIGAGNLSGTQPTSPLDSQMNGVISGVTSDYFLEPRSSKVMSTFGFGTLLETVPFQSLVNISMKDTDCLVLGLFCIKNEEFEEVRDYYEEIFNQHPDKIFIIGAANDNIDTSKVIPASINTTNTLIVGATTIDDARASFSNFGSGVDLASPGRNVYAPAILEKGNFPASGSEANNYTTNFGGTSASAPMVTGVAGILKALELEYKKYSPSLVMNPATMKATLIASADPIDTGEPNKPIGKDCFNFITGTHTGCRLNAHRAVAWWFPPATVQLNQPTTVALAQLQTPFPQALSSLTPPTLEEPENFEKGVTEGTGTHFEITDSDYLNVTIDSTEEITLRIESIPNVINLIFSSSSQATSTQITISGLEPNKTYYEYQDDYHHLTEFVVDEYGSYSYIQNLQESHLTFIQPEQSTKFISDDLTGGDCISIGIWESTTKTCTLTADVMNESVQIDSDGITLDGNGHIISGSDTGFGVFLTGRSNVIIKNLTIQNFSIGIYIHGANENVILLNNKILGGGFGIYVYQSFYNQIKNNNIVTNGQYGIIIGASHHNEVTNNTVERGAISIYNSENTIVEHNIIDGVNRFAGIDLRGVTNGIIRHNKIFNNSIYGIFIRISSANIISDNNISDSSYGIGFLENGIGNEIYRNNIVNNVYAFLFLRSYNNSIYNNNFVNNQNIAYNYGGGHDTSDNVFSLELPIGGNYWSNFDTPEEGCNNLNDDRICDSPLLVWQVFYRDIYNYDYFPWITQNGWEGSQAVDVELSWVSPDDFASTTPDFVSYQIFRNTTSNVTTNDTLVEIITDQNQTTHIDQDLDTGQTYYYKIFTFDGAGLSSGSNEKSIGF